MNYVIGGVLVTLSVIDIRERKIPIWPVLFIGAVLFAMRLHAGVLVGELICGLIPGVLLLIVAWVTKEKLGIGDGILVFCLGLGYGIEEMMTMIGVSFAVAALVSVGLMVLGKATRKTELPFLPFLLVGWLVGIFI